MEKLSNPCLFVTGVPHFCVSTGPETIEKCNLDNFAVYLSATVSGNKGFHENACLSYWSVFWGC